MDRGQTSAEGAPAERDSRSGRREYGSGYFHPDISEPYRHLEQVLVTLERGPGASFLDLCCGEGIHSIHPAKLGYQVVGVDRSAQAIETAAALSERQGVASRCRFDVGDALEFLDGGVKYDVIFVSGSLYYLPFEEAMSAIRLALKPGGYFICIETNGANRLMGTYRWIRSSVTGYRDKQTLSNLLDFQDLAALLGRFEDSRLIAFDFLTLAGFLLRPFPSLAARFQRFASRLDRFILNRLGLVNLGFKMLFLGRLPPPG